MSEAILQTPEQRHQREAAPKSEPLALPSTPPTSRDVAEARQAFAEVHRESRSRLAAIGKPRTWPRIPFYPVTFILMVLVPAFFSTIYLVFLASDQFQVETRFAVRAAPGDSGGESDLKSALSNLTSGGSPTMATQDAHILAAYLQSRAAIQDLENKGLDLKAIFRRANIDFYARLRKDASAEDFETYWKSMISASVDGPSGIVTLFVRAFQPDDAKRIAQGLIEVGESLVNVLSERARQDTLQKAEDEVRRAEGRMRQALLDLRRFRDEEGLLDPVKAAGNTATLMLNAMSDRIKTQNDLFVAERALGPNAPSIITLRARLATIDQQIEKMRSSLTSTDATANPVSAALLRFEELEVQRIFSEKLYALAQNGLERARQRADRKQIYISVFVPPMLPEEARFPERITYPLIILTILVIVWGIFALTCAAVEDHLY